VSAAGGQRPSPVGPVLEANEIGRAVATAIVTTNPGASVEDRGAYLRVCVLGRCVVERRAIESELGRDFTLPRDLELVMPAFQGRLSMNDDRVEWRFEGA
jgi:hypothetical protein